MKRRIECRFSSEGRYDKPVLLHRINNPFPVTCTTVLLFLQEAKKAKAVWDLIILDPPSFSNSKKMRTSLDIRRDHGELIRSCLSLLSPEGKLYFSSNAKGFNLEDGDFPGFNVKDIGKALVDEDFRGKRIPVCYRICRTQNPTEIMEVK